MRIDVAAAHSVLMRVPLHRRSCCWLPITGWQLLTTSPQHTGSVTVDRVDSHLTCLLPLRLRARWLVAPRQRFDGRYSYYQPVWTSAISGHHGPRCTPSLRRPAGLRPPCRPQPSRRLSVLFFARKQRALTMAAALRATRRRPMTVMSAGTSQAHLHPHHRLRGDVASTLSHPQPWTPCRTRSTYVLTRATGLAMPARFPPPPTAVPERPRAHHDPDTEPTRHRSGRLPGLPRTAADIETPLRHLLPVPRHRPGKDQP